MNPFLSFHDGRWITDVRKLARLSAFLSVSLVLTGCAALNSNAGFSHVENAARQHIDQTVSWQRSDDEISQAKKRVNELLAAPLNANDAVQIALLNNRGLQASFYELGISEADLIQAGRLPNPGFTFGRMRQGSDTEIDRGIVFNLMKLLTMPITRQIEQRRFEEVQHQITLQILSLASETRKAYFTAVAAEQTLLYMHDVKKAADAGAELAQRMLKAGNFSQLQQAREQSFYADAVLNLARARQFQTISREKLIRLMGLSPDQQKLILPHRLPDLPKTVPESAEVEQSALSKRLDVEQAQLKAAQLAKNLDLNKATRFINVLEAGASRNTFSDAPVERGYEIAIELPLFDWGDARVAKSEALYRQALENAQQSVVNARSEIREAYAIYHNRFEIARHYYDDVLPLKKRISEQNQLLYNGMFISVFELLADARSQMMAVNGAIEASRDFWLAKADLDMTLLGPVRANDAPENIAISAEN